MACCSTAPAALEAEAKALREDARSVQDQISAEIEKAVGPGGGVHRDLQFRVRRRNPTPSPPACCGSSSSIDYIPTPGGPRSCGWTKVKPLRRRDVPHVAPIAARKMVCAY